MQIPWTVNLFTNNTKCRHSPNIPNLPSVTDNLFIQLLRIGLEGMARCAGQRSAHAKGFGLQLRFFCPAGNQIVLQQEDNRIGTELSRPPYFRGVVWAWGVPLEQNSSRGGGAGQHFWFLKFNSTPLGIKISHFYLFFLIKKINKIHIYPNKSQKSISKNQNNLESFKNIQ